MLDEGCCNVVMLGYHRMTKVKVAIKVINKKDFDRLSEENNISETSAMGLCSESHYIATMVETFNIGTKVYLITKFAQGRDLLHYCMK